ncbi:MAG: hypothetical protein H6905_05515 [Hyphomicrobiales bacterium]|nr:hypothetical protein [Hyphomicrobiales bacterium]
MNPADIAALLYAVVMLGQTASRSLTELKSGQVSEEEFQQAWALMQQRLQSANALWQHVSAGEGGQQSGGNA